MSRQIHLPNQLSVRRILCRVLRVFLLYLSCPCVSSEHNPTHAHSIQYIDPILYPLPNHGADNVGFNASLYKPQVFFVQYVALSPSDSQGRGGITHQSDRRFPLNGLDISDQIDS